MSDDPSDPSRRLEDLLAEHRDAEDPESEAAEEPFDPFAPVTDPDPKAADADEEKGEDEDPQPHTPIFALLKNIEQEIGIDRIDRMWIFPPRRVEAGETAVVVVAAFPDVEADRRRVYAAHYTAREEAGPASLSLDEYGTAPTDRVGRLVEEVVERIKDGPAEAPRSHHVDGLEDRWNTILHELAETHLAGATKHPRIRR